MDLFVIDTCPNQDLYAESASNGAQEQVTEVLSDDEEDEDYGG